MVVLNKHVVFPVSVQILRQDSTQVLRDAGILIIKCNALREAVHTQQDDIG